MKTLQVFVMLLGIVVLLTTSFSAQEKAGRWNMWSDSPTISQPDIASPMTSRPENLGFPDNPDIQIFPSSNPQTENSIAINPNNPNQLLITTNGRLIQEGGETIYAHQTHFYSLDGGITWLGSENNPNGIQTWGDPVALFNTTGDAYYVALGNPAGIYVLKSNDGGATWGSTVNADPNNSSGDDKEHAMTDLSGTYQNNLYVAWTDFNTSNNAVVLTRSTNKGDSFGSRITLHSGTDRGQGTNIAIGPSGEVYVAFANYANGNLPENGIRFTKSLDGGATFSNASIAFNLSGIRTANGGLAEFNNTRVNSFPSMDTDRSTSPFRGNIYITYADRNTGDSDIYLRRSSDGGTTWSSAKRVNDDPIENGKQQWFPSIAVDPVTGIIYISYYNMDSDGFLTTRYVAISNDGGGSFTAFRIGDVRFTPVSLGSPYSAGYMGDYYEIVAHNNKAFATWSDNRTGQFQAFVSRFDISREVVVDQILADGNTRIGTLGRWDGSDFEPRLSSPQTFTFSLLTTEVLHGDVNIHSGQKYYQWNNDPNVINHHEFEFVQTVPNTFISNFQFTYEGVVLENNLFSTSSSQSQDGSIEFQDPWLIDYPDPNYNNHLRNQGILAPLKSKPSPFTPDYSTSYSGDIYKGVFLNQNPQFQAGIPFYTIQSSTQTFEVNGKTITWDWESWDYDPAKIDLQYPESNSTGIVFKSAAATVTANLKGRKTSDNALATFGNNSGKITTFWSSATQRSLQMLYEDRGHIYRAYQDQSFNWQKDVKIATATTNTTFSRPAIDYFYDLSPAPGDKSGYVWQSFNSSSNRWSIASNLGSYPGTLSLTEEPAPTISGYSNGSSSNSGVIVYRNPLLAPKGEAGGDALELWFTNDDELVSISGGIDAQFPAIDNREYAPSITQYNEPHYMLTWQNSSGIQYLEFQREEDQGDQISTEHSTVLSAGQSSLNFHEFPSINSGGVFAEGDEMVHVVWQAIEDGGQIEKTSAPTEKLTAGCPPASMDVPVVCFRQKAGGLLNNWEPVVIFQTGNTCDRKPVVSSWPNGSQRDIAIAYEGAEGRTDYVLRQNGTWSTASVLTSDGANPALTVLHSGSSYIPQLAYTEFQAAPHRIMVRDDLLGGSKTELALQPAHSRRVSFNLGTSLSSAATLNFDGELTLEIADPLYSDDTGTQTLQPKVRGSQVGAANVFQFDAVIPSGSKPQLQIPVKITGRYLKSRVSGFPVNVPLPLMSIQISDATTQLALNTARTFTSDLLSFSGDSTRFKEVTDTLIIDLSRWNGRQIEISGKLYLGAEQEDVAVAEVYDLRNSTTFKEILAKSTGDDDAEQIRRFALLPNYPNPFNPSTTIPFMVPRETEVEIAIFDINGKRIKRLISSQYPAGQHEIIWDGRSDAGIQVSSGIYFYRMKAAGFIQTRKFLLTK